MDSNADSLVERLRQSLAERTPHPERILVHEARLEGREARFATLRPRLPSGLGIALQRRGIRQLYQHQVDAIQAARQGRDVVITTPTASGKSLAFNVPVLERLLNQPERKALYLYPTKALMNDQRRALESLIGELDVPRPPAVGTLSGDVVGTQREELRRGAMSLLIANPDIVHHEVLRRHPRWQNFLSKLDFIVIDEMHDYRGVFGANVALILRRLIRAADLHGASPTCIAASATIANPEELAHALLGRPFELIDGSGAGVGAPRFLIWRPPPLKDSDGNRLAGIEGEAVRLFVDLLRADRRVILFGPSRMAVERIFARAQQQLGKSWSDRISAYRSGYSISERARIESALRDGSIHGVVSTNALELGIDIGTLDTAILVGYPGSVMSTWQQAGRVGRRGDREALIILIAGDDALDQYFAQHPDRLFASRSENAVIDPANPHLLVKHLVCASAESPLQPSDLRFFPDSAANVLADLQGEGVLTSGKPSDTAAAVYQGVSIRGVRTDATFSLVMDGRGIGQLEQPYLQREAYPGATYLHNGQRYIVSGWDRKTRRVFMEKDDSPFRRTEPIAQVNVSPRGEPLATRSVRVGAVSITATLGQLQAVESVETYREHARPGRPWQPRDLPERLQHTIDTIGVWIDLTPEQHASYDSLHAVEHSLVNILPLHLLCDRRDVGSTSDRQQSPGGRVILFDRSDGGAGLCERAYQPGLLEALLEEAGQLLHSCPCEEGCPSCLVLPGCARGNDGLDKQGALLLLQGRGALRSTRSAQAARPAQREDSEPRMAAVKASTSAASEPDKHLRRVIDKEQRRRLHPLVGKRAATTLGPVTIVDVDRERVQVRYDAMGSWGWLRLKEIRLLEPAEAAKTDL